MKKKSVVIIVAGVAIAVLAVWGFMKGREELTREQQREAPIKVPLRVKNEAGGPVVTFDVATQKRADIAVAAAAPGTRHADIEALAVVLPPRGLIELRNRYVATTAQADKASAALHASRREYERLKALHGDDRNISDRVLQAAEVAWRSDEAAVRAAQAAVDALKRSARQQWGAVLTSAVVENASSFQRLSMQKEVLLRIAAPSGVRLLTPPATVSVVRDDGRLSTARLISPSPQADPRIQGPAFFYAAAAAGLLPGTTLTTRLPVGPEETGAMIPASAVVWWQGKGWFYVQSEPNQFVRRELIGAMPVAEGWFVPQLQPVRIVVRGAQTLLSEELRGQIQAGGEDG